MKKTFLILISTAIAASTFCQVTFGVQLMGSAGTASIDNPDLGNYSTKLWPGAGAGIMAHYNVSTHLGLWTSLNCLQKGNKIDYKDPAYPGKPFSITSTLKYLEVPLYVTYQIPLKRLTLFAGAGPSFGYGFAGKLRTEGWWEILGAEGASISEPYDFDVKAYKKETENGAELKRFEISGTALAGMAFRNGLFVHASYLHGFTNLVKEGSYRNRGALLTVGFMMH